MPVKLLHRRRVDPKDASQGQTSRRHWSPGSGDGQRCVLRANLTGQFEGPFPLKPQSNLVFPAYCCTSKHFEISQRQYQCAMLAGLCRLLDLVYYTAAWELLLPVPKRKTGLTSGSRVSSCDTCHHSKLTVATVLTV